MKNDYERSRIFPWSLPRKLKNTKTYRFRRLLRKLNRKSKYDIHNELNGISMIRIKIQFNFSYSFNWNKLYGRQVYRKEKKTHRNILKPNTFLD